MKEINAEMLLGYLYPETDRKWNVNCRGTFYRNYNDDCLSCDPDEGTIDLARDGFQKSLPRALFTDQEDPAEVEDNADREFKEAILREAFAPFDSFQFAQGLAIEKTISSLLADKFNFILKTYYDFDLDAESDPLVREAAMLLPIIRTRRGNPMMVKVLLSSLLHCDVILDCSHRESEGRKGAWLPKVICTLVIPGLSPEEYCRKKKEVEPLRDFLKDRFLPFDVAFEIRIRDCGMGEERSGDAADAQMLDYNCQIK